MASEPTWWESLVRLLLVDQLDTPLRRPRKARARIRRGGNSPPYLVAGMAAIGHPKTIAQSRERLGEPIEAVCLVRPWGDVTRRLLGQPFIPGQATPGSVMVLTDSKLYLFEPKLRVGLGAELLCVPYSDIVHVERHFRILGTGFRLTLADGSHFGLKASRSGLWPRLG
jgi:hypothetical protein